MEPASTAFPEANTNTAKKEEMTDTRKVQTQDTPPHDTHIDSVQEERAVSISTMQIMLINYEISR